MWDLFIVFIENLNMADDISLDFVHAVRMSLVRKAGVNADTVK